MALSRYHAALSRPLSVQEITKQADDFEFFTTRSLQAWLRSCKMLLREAEMCELDDNLQVAYLYLYRHAQLVLAKLPQHPDFSNPAYGEDLNEARNAVRRNLAKLEQWKPRINAQHDRYVRAIERRNGERERVQREREDAERRRSLDDDSQRLSSGSENGDLDEQAQTLNANENRQLAVDFAQREIRRRDATKQNTRQAGISPRTVAARRRGIVMSSPDSSEMLDDPSETTSAGVRKAGRHLQESGRRNQEVRRDMHRRVSSRSYQYPTVPTKEDAMDWKMPALQPRPVQFPDGGPPALPAKEFAQKPIGAPSGPPLPPKALEAATLSPPTATSSIRPPSKYTFKPTAFTESGTPLRTVLLPPELRTTFLDIAHPNTLHNMETCGILGGTLVSNALFINHLIIPDQKSTSDTCDTTEEGDTELFDYCDSADLLVCGWIHTHPSQSCFLSSRDLHTSSGYQVMLPEAIAIVCAPRHNPDMGIFRLTDPPGLGAVLSCHKTGLFHPHDENNLYTDALRPGHVVEGPGLKFEVVDLRRS